MEKILIESPMQWLKAQQSNILGKNRNIYVKEEIVAEFSKWAIKSAMIDGFKWGFGAGLTVAVILAVFTKLMVM